MKPKEKALKYLEQNKCTVNINKNSETDVEKALDIALEEQAKEIRQNRPDWRKKRIKNKKTKEWQKT